MRLPPDIVQELDATGRPWDFKLGAKHWKITVGGKLVGILPRNLKLAETGRAKKNVIAQIRRAVK